MWISSQDKECITMVNHLYTNDFGEIRQQEDIILGTYKTKERALEVLSDIQKYINSDVMINLDVYEMPKE